MNFKWLKQYTPRSLYGRAALILIVPIVTIQLVVSIVVIQRLYERVTEQMTRNVLLELRYLVARIDTAPSLAEARARIAPLLGPLALTARLPASAAIQQRRHFYDLSGRIVVKSLRTGLSGVQAVDLMAPDKRVHMMIMTRYGPMEVVFSRDRVSAANPHQLLVLMLFISILMTVIAFVFLRNQLRPIKRLAAVSEAFGKGQVVKYHPTGATEVRAAGASFLAMRARIERQIEQRTMMLSGVSHDLRTPLTRLRLGLSMLEDCPEIDDLIRDVGDMEQLIDGFLDFARGQAGDAQMAVDPVALAREVVAKTVRAGADVVFEGPEQRPGEGPSEALPEARAEGARDPGSVVLRPRAIRRALENLVGNALRYGTRARVRVVLGENTLRYTVEDDGPGIPAERREEALKPFSRLEPARNQNKGPGVGLGLAIALDIARAHGGSLRLGRSADLGGLRVDLVVAL